MQSEPAKERIGFFARTAFQNRDSCIQKPLRSRALSIWQGSFAIWNEKSSNKSANKCLVLAHLLAETRKSSNESTNKCSVFANLFDDFFAFVSAIPKNSCLARKIHDFRPSFRRLPRARSVSAIVRNVRVVKGPPTYFWKAGIPPYRKVPSESPGHRKLSKLRRPCRKSLLPSPAGDGTRLRGRTRKKTAACASGTRRLA